ncbi:MAG: M28 family peptidase [Oscillospiraceae bacterium]
MTAETDHLLKHFQIRKSAAQKAAFQDWLTGVLTAAGYKPRVESGGSLVKSSNVVVGDSEKAFVVYTAHYDTCAVLPVPNFITPRNFFLYLLYQILLCIPMFALAIGAEVLLLVLWEDCPVSLAMVAVYIVLGFCIWWIMDGPANKHTANDNTSGVATLLEIALSLPEKDRSKVAFVFFDNEEKGLLGSSQFKKAHGKRMADTLLINFDCVSEGDFIQFYPNKKLKQKEDTLCLLEQTFLSDSSKTVEVVRGFGFYPSDQKAFPHGVGVAALHKSWFGYWLGRIHTNRDTVFQAENIELLRRGALALAERLTDPHT